VDLNSKLNPLFYGSATLAILMEMRCIHSLINPDLYLKQGDLKSFVGDNICQKAAIKCLCLKFLVEFFPEFE
jgi:hypothetical protein